MGTVNVTSSSGERFIITFSNTNSYNLDEILAAKSRTSQKALVIEVRKNEAIAQKALQELKSDLTNELKNSLETEEVINNVNNIIVSVYNLYGNDGNTAEYAKQLVNAKITSYLKEVAGGNINFDISIYDNRANVNYKLPDSFIDGKFVEYYNRFSNEYKRNLAVSTGGLAISDSQCCANITNNDYANALLGGPSTQSYASNSTAYCNNLYLHECSTDTTCSSDLNSSINNNVPANLESLVNELKKIFVTKDNQENRVETTYVKAANGLFKNIKTGNLEMDNLTADEIIGKNVVADTLSVKSSYIELSDKTSEKYHKLYVNESGLLTIETNNIPQHLITAEYVNGLKERDDQLEELISKLNEDIDVFEAKIGVLPENMTFAEAIDETFVKKEDSYSKSDIDEKLENINVDIDLSNYYNKEEIDTKLEQFTPDVDLDNYYTKEETNNEIEKAVASKVHFDIVICDGTLDDLENSENLKEHTIYLVKSTDPVDNHDFYLEYIYIDSKLELIGTTDIKIDGESIKNWIELKNYATKDDVYTKEEIDTKLEKFTPDVDLDNYYTKEEINNNVIGVAGETMNLGTDLTLVYADGSGSVFGNTYSREQINKALAKIYNLLNQDYVSNENLSDKVEDLVQGTDSKVNAIEYIDLDGMEE